MTTHNDLHDVEARLRASLRERATDVQTTPALYERVQRQASRGTWLRRGFALAAAAAAVTGAVAVVPGLFPDQPLQPDVLETPEDTVPGEETPSEPPTLTAALLDAGVAHALDDGSGGSVVHVGDRTVASARQVVSLTTASTGASTIVVAGRADGSIGVIDVGAQGEEFDQIVDADANGGRAVPTPDADGVAWLEGSDLHVLPLGDAAEVRVLPLDGGVPDDLRVEQWFSQADAQVVLASDPAGGVWSIPMDDSNVFNTAPTTTPFVLDDQALDAALQPTLTTVSLRPDGTRLVLAEGDDMRSLPTQLPTSDAMSLATNDVGAVTVVDGETGTGFLLELVDGALGSTVTTQWQDPQITAAVQVVVLGAGGGPSAEAAPASQDAAALGLRTDAPVIGTDGVALVIREADGTETRRDVYPPAESEAALGDLAVRPGSTSDDGLVAIESSSEGETSIRFVPLHGDTAGPVGSVVVTAGEVTGLVWSEDGTHVAWTDPDGLWAIEIVGDGEQAGAPQFLAEDQRAIVDWVWTEGGDGATLGGWFALRTGQSGTEFLGVEQSSDGGLALTAPVGGSDRLVFDTHASPSAAVGPDVSAELLGSEVALRWGADGDRFGELASPGDVGGDVEVEVAGGQVVVMGSQRHVLVTFDGDVVELPVLTDWDVLD